MDPVKVLLIESARASSRSFAPELDKRYLLSVAYSGRAGQGQVPLVNPAVIVVDAVSMRTSGDRICTSLKKAYPAVPVVHIRPRLAATRKGGHKEHRKVTDLSPADIILHPEFTWRKLTNRINRLVESNCPDDDEGLQIGYLRLIVPRRLLMVRDQEKRLTPKLTCLAEQFFRQPNTIIERKTLIQRVWDTDYMGDTRTLDVHIRWLRELLEENPGKPKLIKTVRGVGYRLIPPLVENQRGEKTG